MCWGKFFGGGSGQDDDYEFLSSTHKALLFGINNYPGSANDLNGCLNDIDDFEVKLKQLWPQFKVRKFKDYQVTNLKFLLEMNKAIEALNPGDVVVTFMDCCHAKSNTKNSNPVLSRFHDPGIERKKIKPFKRRVFRSADTMKWIAFSACQENQTAADAYFNCRANGAFSYYNIKALKQGMLYGEHSENISVWLPSKMFNQIPAHEGPDYLLDKKMFVEPTLVIAYSGHGSYLPDNDGDEPDGYDETLYLYDGHCRDDKINEILQKIPI